jgi:hypothetical protein
MESLNCKGVPLSYEQQETHEVGRVYKRCGCREEVGGRQRGARCFRLVEPSHGRWYLAVQLPGVDGRQTRIRRGGYASRAEAERACTELLLLPGPRAVARMWTVRRWLEFWVSEIEDRLRPSTVRSYRTIVHQHLIPHLGSERLSTLRTVRVQRAMDAVSRRRVRGGRLISAGTAHRIRAVLRSALAEARRQGVIGHNPAWRLRLPNGARPHAVVWDDERDALWRGSWLRSTAVSAPTGWIANAEATASLSIRDRPRRPPRRAPGRWPTRPAWRWRTRPGAAADVARSHPTPAPRSTNSRAPGQRAVDTADPTA